MAKKLSGKTEKMAANRQTYTKPLKKATPEQAFKGKKK